MFHTGTSEPDLRTIAFGNFSKHTQIIVSLISSGLPVTFNRQGKIREQKTRGPFVKEESSSSTEGQSLEKVLKSIESILNNLGYVFGVHWLDSGEFVPLEKLRASASFRWSQIRKPIFRLVAASMDSTQYVGQAH
jgi:hypothetical protein